MKKASIVISSLVLFAATSSVAMAEAPKIYDTKNVTGTVMIKSSPSLPKVELVGKLMSDKPVTQFTIQSVSIGGPPVEQMFIFGNQFSSTLECRYSVGLSQDKKVIVTPTTPIVKTGKLCSKAGSDCVNVKATCSVSLHDDQTTPVFTIEVNKE